MIYEKKMIEDVKSRPYIDKALEEIFETIIDEQPKVGEWIPCSERMPDSEGDYYDVLCCDQYKEIMIGRIFEDSESNTGYSATSEHEIMYDVTAWMPLPEPYREE